MSNDSILPFLDFPNLSMSCWNPILSGFSLLKSCSMTTTRQFQSLFEPLKMCKQIRHKRKAMLEINNAPPFLAFIVLISLHAKGIRRSRWRRWYWGKQSIYPSSWTMQAKKYINICCFLRDPLIVTRSVQPGDLSPAAVDVAVFVDVTTLAHFARPIFFALFSRSLLGVVDARGLSLLRGAIFHVNGHRRSVEPIGSRSPPRRGGRTCRPMGEDSNGQLLDLLYMRRSGESSFRWCAPPPG